MGEFQNVATKIAEIINEMKQEGGISTNRLSEIIASCVGRGESHINCYPGIPVGGCCDIALSISLTLSSHKKGRGHLPFRKAVEKVVQHMQGNCSQTTRFAILIADSWDPEAYEEWKSNFDVLKKRRKTH